METGILGPGGTPSTGAFGVAMREIFTDPAIGRPHVISG